jgi:hypothetical protein
MNTAGAPWAAQFARERACARKPTKGTRHAKPARGVGAHGSVGIVGMKVSWGLLVAVLALAVACWQGWTAWDAERRSLRAYVTSDDPLVTSVTNSAGAIVEWKILPRWADHGKTPTRNLTFIQHCIAVHKDTGDIIAETKTTLPATPRHISPDHPVGTGLCSLTADQVAANFATGILNGARSTVDYFDVFGQPHHSEQCFTVEFLDDPLSNRDAKRVIGSCERNCEDEECQTVLAPAQRRSLRDLLGGIRLTPASPPGR